MAHIRSQKKLLSADLKDLISHVTGFEDGSPDFKKCEDSAWSIIVDRYYPSVNEHRVKSDLLEFVEKFKVHGFPQKAQNLSSLINAYSKLTYFKRFSNTEVQWGLIDLIIKLSYKPTSALDDDPPLDLNKSVGNAEESFDWGAYLKEGLEKFQVPSENEDSLSEWSNSSEENEPPEQVPIIQELVPLKKAPIGQLWGIDAEQREALQRAELAFSLHKQLAVDKWWENENLRELPISNDPEANYCFFWENITKATTETRILSEHKVVMELIYMLGIPSECYFIVKASENSWKVTPNTSIASLSPNVFAIVVEENFCKYFPHIKKLLDFLDELDRSKMPSTYIPAVYRAYGFRIRKILRWYSRELIKLEKKAGAQDEAVTMRVLLAKIAPFLSRLEYLSKLHDIAVPKGWRCQNSRTNAFRLLCVLYEELKETKLWFVGTTDWLAKNLLILFADSLRPFLCQLAEHMTGHPHKITLDEFFITSTGEIIVPWETTTSREFWEPVLKTASSAIASCSFLKQLDRYSTFFKNDYNRDILYIKLVEKLAELLLFIPLNIEGERKVDIDKKQERIDNFAKSFGNGTYWDKPHKETRSRYCNKSATDLFCSLLRDVDLSTYALHITIKDSLRIVIEEYMEPKGFAADILLFEFKLLDHLRALFSSIQVTNVLCNVLITHFHGLKNWKRIQIDFEDCLNDSLPPKYVQNFRLYFDHSSKENDLALLEFPDKLKLCYMVDSKLASVISEDTVNGYAAIFNFLMKVRLALATLNRLMLERITETKDNFLRLRRLSNLRTWFLHAMNSLNLYFSTYTDIHFQIKMKDLCSTERKLCTIHKAHMDFVESWKSHCFLTEGHPCMEHVMELLNLTLRLKLYWKMEQKNELANYHLDDIEKVYCETVNNMALSLQLFDDRLVDTNDTFSFLYDEITNNLPMSPEENIVPNFVSTFFSTKS